MKSVSSRAWRSELSPSSERRPDSCDICDSSAACCTSVSRFSMAFIVSRARRLYASRTGSPRPWARCAYGPGLAGVPELARSRAALSRLSSQAVAQPATTLAALEVSGGREPWGPEKPISSTRRLMAHGQKGDATTCFGSKPLSVAWSRMKLRLRRASSQSARE